MTNIATAKEFSWHLAYPECIETIRDPQVFPNCWAVSLASCIGDNFCITENIEPIYPSSIWITSLNNAFHENYGRPLVNLTTGGIMMGPKFLEFITKNCSISLERCYGGIKTLIAIDENEFLKNGGGIPSDERIYQTILTPDSFFKCCENCLYWNKKTMITDCSTKISSCRDKDEPNYKFKIELDHLDYYLFSYYSMSTAIIKKEQNTIKRMLCDGPINSDFTATTEYFIYGAKQLNNTTVEVFCPKKVNALLPNHTIEILGWGFESNIEFLYIKDSNFPSLFLKIAFATMENLDYSIGPDFTKYQLASYFPWVFVLYGVHLYSIKPKALDKETKQKLIKNGLITRSKPRDILDLMHSIV